MRAMVQFLWAALALVAPAAALWPLPRQFTAGNDTLRLSNSFSFVLNVPDAPSDLTDALSRTASFLNSDNLAPLTPDRGATIDASSSPQLQQLVLSLANTSDLSNVSSIAEEVQKPLSERDEGYVLDVPNDGSNATLTANTTLGLFRGLTTFSQLWYTSNGATYAMQTPLEVTDEPAYPFRGFMLDTARNFFPTSDIKRTLDAMSLVKLNVFHWHITDSQSFPVQIPGFEDVANAGAYLPSLIYSAQDVADIISYAGERGIDVMLEIDTPGHTTAIGAAHPDFIACFDAVPWSPFANEPPAGQLRITESAVVNFTTSLFEAVAGMVKSQYVSTGGDEINQACYDNDTVTQQGLITAGQTFEEVLSSFVVANHKVLESAGKTPTVWEEMVLAHNVSLSPETLVFVWISSADAVNVTEAGFPIVQAPSDFFYLDCGGGAWVGADPGANSWCDPFKSWQRSYSYDPLANLTSDAQKALVMGGESLLWTEQSGPQNLDPIVWPRAATAAEVFWLGETMPDSLGGGNRSTAGIDTALPRLHDVSFRMRQRGVNTISLQPEWCALRPERCDLTA